MNTVNIEDLEKSLRVKTTPEQDFDIFKLYVVERANGIEKAHEEAVFQRYYKKMNNEALKEFFMRYFKDKEDKGVFSFLKGGNNEVDKLSRYIAEGYRITALETWGRSAPELENFTKVLERDPKAQLYKLEAESLSKGSYLITNELKRETIAYLKGVIEERNGVIVGQARKLNDISKAYENLKTAYNVLVRNVKEKFGLNDEQVKDLQGVKKDRGRHFLIPMNNSLGTYLIRVELRPVNFRNKENIEHLNLVNMVLDMQFNPIHDQKISEISEAEALRILEPFKAIEVNKGFDVYDINHLRTIKEKLPPGWVTSFNNQARDRG